MCTGSFVDSNVGDASGAGRKLVFSMSALSDWRDAVVADGEHLWIWMEPRRNCL